MVIDRSMTQADRWELFDAYVTRFREGEIGPLTFRDICEKIGVSRDEIDVANCLYIDECAKNMRNGKGC